MWPFLGGLLTHIDFTLKVPGQDSEQAFNTVGQAPVYSGIRFQTSTGYMDRRLANGTWQQYSADPDMWIHSDTKDPDIFISSKYECRLVDVLGDTAYMGGDTYGTTGYGANDFWHDMTTGPNWWISETATFGINEFTGTIQIREKADHTNIRTGAIRVKATEIGL